MKGSIEVIIAATGEIKIDAIGFKGADCEHATRFLEQALGVVRQRDQKPEYRRKARLQQRVGS